MKRALLLLGALGLAGCDRPATSEPSKPASAEAKASPSPKSEPWKPKAGEICWATGPKYQGKMVVVPTDYEAMMLLLRHIENDDGPPLLGMVADGKAYLFPLDQVQVKVVRVIEEPYRAVRVQVVGGNHAGKEGLVLSANLRSGK